MIERWVSLVFRDLRAVWLGGIGLCGPVFLIVPFNPTYVLYVSGITYSPGNSSLNASCNPPYSFCLFLSISWTTSEAGSVPWVTALRI